MSTTMDPTYKSYWLAILLASFAGIFTIFLPWIHFPIANISAHGYIGDGYITSFLFFVIFVLGLSTMLQKQPPVRIAHAMLIVFSALLIIISGFKIFKINDAIQHDSASNVLYSYASSGMYVSYGLYAILVLGVFLFLCLTFAKHLDTFIKQLVAFGFLCLSVLILHSGSKMIHSAKSLNSSDSVVQVQKSFESMNDALSKKDISTFMSYMHPTLINTMGGETQFRNILSQIYDKGSIKDNQITSIEPIVQVGANVQAIINHLTSSLDPVTNTIQTKENKTVGFSNDGGHSWVFASVDGKSFKDFKKNFPELFNNLESHI